MLVINHLSKQYKNSGKGIKDVSIEVEKGDIFAFIGHNGAGKTTTIKCITGLHDFDEGSVLIAGNDIKKDSIKCKSILAYVPDNPDIYEYMTGNQYLNFVADVYNVSKEDRKECIEKYAKEFEIEDRLGDLISSYSHGMKQKVSIIAAIVHKPLLLVLDEPFVGLDPKAIVVLKGLMNEFCEKGGAIFFSTHVLDVAEKLCNKVAILKKGQIITSGDMKDFVKNGISLEEVFMEGAQDEEN